MDKPIIFFSHSSYDEKALRKLKDLLTKKTGNTIEIFLSCDGQSIPLGRNWVSRLEEALKQAKIMLVFLSPMSLHSRWIYFEAGFSYRQDVQVVPVGILGIDLEQVGPPLGLLQGFNIKSADGLNNIIALINDTFSYSHEKSFTEAEYDEIFGEDQLLRDGALGKYVAVVDEIRIDLPCDASLAFDKIPKLFDNASIQYQLLREAREIHASGLSLAIPSSGTLISAKLDPTLTALTLGILDNVVKNLCEEQPDSYSLRIIFMSWVTYCTPRHRLTARLYGTDIKFGTEDNLVFGEIVFRFRPPLPRSYISVTFDREPSKVYLDIEYRGKTLNDIRLSDLLNILFERGVLYPYK